MIAFADTATKPQAVPGVDTIPAPEPMPEGPPPTPTTWKAAERLGEEIAELAAHMWSAW